MIIRGGYSRMVAEFERHCKGDKFTDVALKALYDYKESMVEGDDWVLDVPLLTMTWFEYESLTDLADDYDDLSEYTEDEVLEQVEAQTCVIPLSNGGYLVMSR